MKKYTMAATVIVTALLLTGMSACSEGADTEEHTEEENTASEAAPETVVSEEKLAKEAVPAEESEEDAAPAEETVEDAAPAEEAEEDAPVEADSATMEFVDAHGERHEMEIADAVTRHTFDWDRLSGSGLDRVYEDETYTSRIGIDVSEHQGTIDWQAVRDAGVTFAFMRIGGRGYGDSGTLYADTRALTNIAGAQEAGLDVGVYFFSQAVSEEEAVEEAEYVLGLLDGTPLQMPVVYDPETIVDDVARTDDVSGEQFTKDTLAFCDRIREAGYTPMVYCNMMWEAFELDLAALQEADIPLWYADYETLPQTPYQFSIWQFANNGRIDGIGTTVDLDIQIYEK